VARQTGRAAQYLPTHGQSRPDSVPGLGQLYLDVLGTCSPRFLRREGSVMSKRCYVSIPFGKKQTEFGEVDFDEVYKSLIEPAVHEVGYEPCTFREHFSNAAISDTTIRLISESEAMIADITGNNPNVLYELGVRHSFVPTGTLIIRNTSHGVPFDLTNFYISSYSFSGHRPDAPYTLPDDKIVLANNLRKICADNNANMVYRNARYSRLHDEYQLALEKFHAIAPYESSIFVMTKYPNLDPKTQTDDDRKLERVIDVVKKAINANGYVSRIADDRPFHNILWKNVEIYLLGCSKGVAIVENKYGADVNPNVAMEWGWMRASSKDVLYLLERDFKNNRADFTPFLSKGFEWDYPEKDIEAAINGWFAAMHRNGLPRSARAFSAT
jgi:hypothetical protein